MPAEAALTRLHGQRRWTPGELVVLRALARSGETLVAENDGSARHAPLSSGSGLIGMRERLNALGDKLAVQPGASSGFTVDVWLPSRAPHAA